jgi:hypothetical protein
VTPAAPAALSGYTPVPFGNFAGGINLRDKADVVSDSEAIDLLNVQFLERGAIKQRDGYAELTSSSLTNRVDSMAPFYTASGTKQLIAGCGSRLEALSTAGAVVASQTGLAGGPYTFARFAAPGSEFIYCANGSNVTLRWDGATWTTGAASATVNGVAAQNMPKAGAVCVTASVPGSTSGSNAANRLVATAYGTQTTAGPAGTTSTPSRVHFSNPGLPETWETDGTTPRGRNWIDLTPGDGEQIMNAVTWRELVFVFKETKFFVMWSESAASDGTPVFNFREVVSGVGLAAKQAVCVGRDGVYFMARNGVYFTNGGEPKPVSDKILPMWTGDVEVYFQSQTINASQIALSRMVWHDEQVFLSVPTGVATANDRVLVYDTLHGWWSLYDLPASALASFRRADQPELHFGYSTGNNRVARITRGLTDDNGAVITSRWRSGWFDYSSPVNKTIRESKVWGTDAVVCAFSKDFELSYQQTATAVFGSSLSEWPGGGGDEWPGGDATDFWPAGGQVDAALVRKAIRGTVFSTQFSNAPGYSTWSVHRVTRGLREQRESSIVGTES